MQTPRDKSWYKCCCERPFPFSPPVRIPFSLMGILCRQELVLSLSAPYFSFNELRSFALVSRHIAEIVIPFIFHTLKPLVVGQCGLCKELELPLQSLSLTHANFVR